MQCGGKCSGDLWRLKHREFAYCEEDGWHLPAERAPRTAEERAASPHWHITMVKHVIKRQQKPALTSTALQSLNVPNQPSGPHRLIWTARQPHRRPPLIGTLPPRVLFPHRRGRRWALQKDVRRLQRKKGNYYRKSGSGRLYRWWWRRRVRERKQRREKQMMMQMRAQAAGAGRSAGRDVEVVGGEG